MDRIILWRMENSQDVTITKHTYVVTINTTFCSILNIGRHFEWSAGQSDIILKGDHPLKMVFLPE